jgi:hypothetical protein
MHEIQLLNEGGNWKTIAEEKEKQIEVLTKKASRLTAELETTRRSTVALGEKLRMALQHTRRKMEIIQRETQCELAIAAPQALREFAEKVLQRMQVEIADATQDLVSKYRYEVRQRKVLYNKLQEMKGDFPLPHHHNHLPVFQGPSVR